jgi:hypothetical protein
MSPNSTDSIVKDLTPQVDKPSWPLSSYGPAKYEPVLIPNLDESQEELRVRAQAALKAGTPNDYVRTSCYANFRKHVTDHDLIFSSSMRRIR